MVWHVRIKPLVPSSKVTYVPVEDCFLYNYPQDLCYKLRKITAIDKILKSDYVLSLIVPTDYQEVWNLATIKASKLRTIHSDFRYSLYHYKSMNNSNCRKKYSYVSANVNVMLLNNFNFFLNFTG